MKSLRRGALMVGFALALTSSAGAQVNVSGSWVTHSFGEPVVFVLQSSGRTVTGTINRTQDVMDLTNGVIDGNTITFSAASPSGERDNAFRGTVSGDQISFTRTVSVRPGGTAAGTGIYGGASATAFVAVRSVPNGLPVPHALLGNWRADFARSRMEPGTFGVAEEQRSYIARVGGGLTYLSIRLSPEGASGLVFNTVLGDGRDYPSYGAGALANLLASDAPSPVTVALRAIDDRTFEYTTKNSGVVSATTRLTISPDGRTLTETGETVNARGERQTSWTVVFERAGARPVPPT
jgi:hypothetical protein